MFKFLKEKLKKAVEKFTRKVVEEAEDIVEEVPTQVKKPEPKKVPTPKKTTIKKQQPEPIKEPEKPAREVEEPEIKKPVVKKAPKKPVEEIKKTTSEKKEKTKPPEPKDTDTKQIAGEKPPEEALVEDIPAPKAEEPAQEPDKEHIPKPIEEEKIEEIVPETKGDKPKEMVPEEIEKDIEPEVIEKKEPKIEEPPFETPTEPPKVEKPVKRGFFTKLKDKFTHKEIEEPEIPVEKPEEISEKETKPEKKVSKEKIEEPKEELDQEIEETKPQEPKEKIEETIEKVEPEIEKPEKMGFFSRIKEKITKKKISNEKFEELFYDFELALLENNMAMEVIDKIKTDLKKDLVDKPLARDQLETAVLSSLTNSISSLLDMEKIDLESRLKNKKPYVICFFGINGAGKTTTIAKVAKMFQDNHHQVVLAAADTFRAAAIDQLQLHADKLGVKIIKHDYGADAAAVAFDAVKHAEAKGIDVVLIDTAGRMHSNVNLQDELRKIVRVAKPDLKVFVGEAITGNDCVEQAQSFNETIGIDAIILTKTDVDEKGGAFVSVSYVTKKPIIFIGVGQEYTDLKPFQKEEVMANLGLT